MSDESEGERIGAISRSSGMRILGWNIKWGGQNRISRIVEAVSRHCPEVVVLTEYRSGTSGDAIKLGLKQIGFHAIETSNPIGRGLGVLIASRDTLALRRAQIEIPAELSADHLLAVTVGSDIVILGVYLPFDSRKAPYWTSIHQFARQYSGRRAVLIGDFNTGAGTIDGTRGTLEFASSMKALSEHGFRDPWRDANPDAREYTWGFGQIANQRLDHAFVSNRLKLEGCRAFYSHSERKCGDSDHSLLVLDILAPANTPLNSRA